MTPGDAGLQSLRDDPQKNPQHHVQRCPIPLHEIAQPFGHRQNPLAHRQAPKNMIAQVCRCLHHAPGVAQGEHAPAIAGDGHKVVVSAIVTPGPCKAMRKDAAFQILAKGLADIRLGGLVVTLAVELSCAGQVKPGQLKRKTGVWRLTNKKTAILATTLKK